MTREKYSRPIRCFADPASPPGWECVATGLARMTQGLPVEAAGHLQKVIARNPGGRLTTPEDVARCLVALADPGTQWLTGNVLQVDGGEDVAG